MDDPKATAWRATPCLQACQAPERRTWPGPLWRGSRAGRAREARAGGNHFLAAKGRQAARGGFHEEQGRFRLPQQQPRSGSLLARPVCPKQNCPLQGGGRQVPGKGCAWMARRLVGQAQPSDVGHYVVPTMKLLPISGVHPPLQAWQGEALQCREADGQLLGAEGDHAGHELGRPCCSKRTFGARVLPTTGFEELRQNDDVRPPNTEE